MKHLNGHPNIAGLKGAFEDAKNVYIVMEICAGGELFDRIAERGHYSEKDAADCFRTIMLTVAHCHQRGVIHRDLKPENFVLETSAENARIKAIDFGLGTFFEKNQRFSDVVGTAFYIAPEVLDGDYSEVADVWSAGVILYILLSGNPPFWAPTDKGIFDVGLCELNHPPDPQLASSAWSQPLHLSREKPGFKRLLSNGSTCTATPRR
jgi:calcium-dependent protein kinase